MYAVARGRVSEPLRCGGEGSGQGGAGVGEAAPDITARRRPAMLHSASSAAAAQPPATTAHVSLCSLLCTFGVYLLDTSARQTTALGRSAVVPTLSSPQSGSRLIHLQPPNGTRLAVAPAVHKP